MPSNDKTVYDPGATKPESKPKSLEDLLAELEAVARERLGESPASSATVPDPAVTVYESAATVVDSAATQFDDGDISITAAALSDAAGRTDAPASNLSIQKGDFLLDTYEVDSDAIVGGMGSVWRVHHTGWNADLAMKRPLPACFSTEKSKADFIHECEAWINLGLHPNIVSCYYVREISGTPSIFSEWMDGGSLEGAIKDGTLYAGTEAEQQERILDIAIQFARGLHYAHEARLIHQDVKPDNLLLSKDGDAKVADFGLARARAVLTQLEGSVTVADEPADSGRTIVSPAGGYTPAYCSMEQMDGKTLTRRTDIYSWAVSVMELYVGSRPWANGVVAGLSCREYFADTKLPMPEALRELLAQCMKAEPDDRPHDFAEIEGKLQEIYRAETGNPYPREAPKAAADTADSLNNRALSMLDLGKPEEAERLWEQALKQDSSRFAYHYNYAVYQWKSCRITDAELIEVFRAQKEDSPLWARSVALFSLMRRDERKAEEYIRELEALDNADPALAFLKERLEKEKAIGRPGKEEPLIEPSELSVDGKRTVEGYFKREGHIEQYGYTITDTDTGAVTDYPNPYEYYGEGTPRDGLTYLHAFFPKSDKAQFVGPSSDVVATGYGVLWLFDAHNGRLLRSLPPLWDSDGDMNTYYILGYTQSGFLKYENVFRFNSTTFIKIPATDVRFPYELSRVVSTNERLAAVENVEKNYEDALGFYEAGDYGSAYAALKKSFDAYVLAGHAPSLRLWSALGKHLKRGKLAAVVPTDDAPSPMPKRNAVQSRFTKRRAEDFADNEKNEATNGQTDVSIHLTEKSEYDTYNEYYDYSFDYSLTAYDSLSGELYFLIGYLCGEFQRDTQVLERDLCVQFLGETILSFGKQRWGALKEVDLADRSFQIERRMGFALPAGYFLKNTAKGLEIGGFLFDDVFDGMRPVWNADVIPCRKQNYRLVYQYELLSDDVAIRHKP